MLDTFLKPQIAMAQSEHVRLMRLADTLSRGNPDLADQLYAELGRAEIFADGDATRRVVRMGSTLEYATDTGDRRAVTLVFPGEEDISAGRISILTPVGIALIGLSVGDTIAWRTLGGRTRQLTVKRLQDRAIRHGMKQLAASGAS
jgi:regulator of nucleoside diphosphate kinase